MIVILFSVITICNLAWLQWPGERAKKLLELTDFVCLSEEEAAGILQIQIHSESEIKSAIGKILALGANCVVLTLGAKGGAFRSKTMSDCEFFAPPESQTAPAAAAVDCTGAGDCFLGALAYFLAERNPVANFSGNFDENFGEKFGEKFDGKFSGNFDEKFGEKFGEILRRCSAVASHSVKIEGTQNSFPFRKDLDPNLFQF